MRSSQWAGIALAIAASVGVTALIFPYVPLHDFVEYWTAAHALVNHQDPYSIAAMMKLQQAMGWSEPQPLMVMSPPQFLPFLIPLGFMHSYLLARLFWSSLSVGMLVVSVFALWDIYGGAAGQRWISLGVAALFYPVWHCLAVAQIGPLLLLGVAGFLWLERRGHFFRAGGAVALTTFKPHLFYLVWLALLLWSIERRELRVLLGAAVGVCVGMGAALMMDHALLSQYAALVSSDYVWEFTSGAGGVLRLLLGHKSHAVQFAPMLPGIVALAWYWRKHRRDWQWTDHLPLILTVSILTAAYGWPFDEVVLLVAVVMVAVRCASSPPMRKPATAWLIGNFLASLAVVLRYGDAPGMTVCAIGVLSYLIFNAAALRQNRETGTAEEIYSRASATPVLHGPTATPEP